MASETTEEPITWATQQFGLDNRIVKACKKAGWIAPTLVQQNAIPLILQGKDVLCRARTGSGKTAAYLIPLLQKILINKGNSGGNAEPGIRALILVPTNELCHQVHKQLSELTYYCAESISMISLAPSNDSNDKTKNSNKKLILKSQSILLRTCPDIIISTPARLNIHLLSKSLILNKDFMETLIVDEADLVLSFGHGDDMISIASSLPLGGKSVQGILMSATLSNQLYELKKLVLHSPALIKLEDGDDINEGKLLQFYVSISSKDKYLLIYVFLRLGLLKGKGILFVNSIDEAYKLRLFLSKFSIRSAALNSELPLTARSHILDEFNRDIFDLLIATDEGFSTIAPSDSDDDDDEEDDEEANEEEVENDEDEEEDVDDNDENEDEKEDLDALLDDSDDDDEEEENEENDDDDDDEDGEDLESMLATVPTKKEAMKQKKQNLKQAVKKTKDDDENDEEENDEYGVARGIDFKGVKFVINVDMPRTTEHYIHRVGRTARAGANGTSLTLVSSDYSDGEHDRLLDIQSKQPPLPLLDGSTVLAQMGTTSHGQGGGGGSSNTQSNSIHQPAPLAFNLMELETFRYRVEDMLRTVSKSSIREERTAELKKEILHSERLSEYFATNPNDLKTLRHDKRAIPSNKQNTLHLSHVPDYLIPRSLRELGGDEALGRVINGRKRRRLRNAANGPKRNKATDPLQSFQDKQTNQDTNENHRIYTKSDDTGASMSGRRMWKMKHKKGEFSKSRSRNTNVTSFAKGQSWAANTKKKS